MVDQEYTEEKLIELLNSPETFQVAVLLLYSQFDWDVTVRVLRKSILAGWVCVAVARYLYKLPVKPGYCSLFLHPLSTTPVKKDIFYPENLVYEAHT